MEGDAALDDRVRIILLHVPVHFFVHQAEGQGLVADERLVVAFRVGDGGFAKTAVCEDAPELIKIPLLVAGVLEQLDPVIRDPHGEAMGEADPALGIRAAKAGHARHVFCHHDGTRLDLGDQFIGELEIQNCLLIGIVAKIIIIGTERPVAVRMIKHRGDAIEAEAIEAELLQPVADVGEQELLHLLLAVIEAFRVPLRMIPFFPCMKILVAGAVEVVEPLGNVFHRVGVNHIEQHGDLHAMGGID